MNGMYITVEYKNIERSTSNGIEKKIFNQIKTFENFGHNILFFNPYMHYQSISLRVLRFIPFCNNFIKWEIDKEELINLDFIYIRKPALMDKDIIKFLKRCKYLNKNIKILMEIPTYPYDNEIHGLTSSYLLIKDKQYRKLLKGIVDRIITYSRDDSLFGIKTIRIPNAIKTDDFICSHKKYHSTVKHFIACSSLSYWHGYDRAIEGIVRYYRNKNKVMKDKVILHIVGDGDELHLYKEMVRKYNIQEYVLFHGYLTGSDLEDIYRKCCIGIDSLGRHRSKVYYNSSLKGKEYCSRGLIIVSGVNTEFDYVKDYKYYIRVTADDSPLDFTYILDKYVNITANRPDEELLTEITDYAKNNFDFSVAMLPINDYLTKDGD